MRRREEQGERAISRKVFVGNLSFDVTRDELLEAFAAAGKVVDAKVPTDRETGRPRGFAFVEFEDEEAVQRCISLMNGAPLKGRPLRVSEAEDRPPRAPGAGRPMRPPSMASFNAPPPESRGFEELREERRRHFGSKPTKGKPYKEKGPRRVERRKQRNVIDDDDY